MERDVNELIHEFMGRDWTKEFFQFRPGSTMPMTTKDLDNYRTSYGWLMPVVEKIVSEKYEDGERLYLRTFGMINEDSGAFMVRFNRQILFEAKTLQEATYLAVCDYVKQPKQNTNAINKATL